MTNSTLLKYKIEFTQIFQALKSNRYDFALMHDNLHFIYDEQKQINSRDTI